MSTARRLVLALVLLVGIAAFAAGVVYLTTPAHSLPSFFPGHGKGGLHHHKYGYGGVALGVVLIAAAAFGWMRASRAARSLRRQGY
jgi:hypothetical protein